MEKERPNLVICCTRKSSFSNEPLYCKGPSIIGLINNFLDGL